MAWLIWMKGRIDPCGGGRTVQAGSTKSIVFGVWKLAVPINGMRFRDRSKFGPGCRSRSQPFSSRSSC